MRAKRRFRGNVRGVAAVALAVSSAALVSPQAAQAQRALGIDVSAWQGSLSQTTWNNVKAAGRDFAFIRASRGGTTGYYNQSDSDNGNRQNTLTQRYDDPYWEQNATRATTAGLFVGPYHFERADIWTNTSGTFFNYGDVGNLGADEAQHMLQQAGAWMKPGFILPTFDLEAGSSQRTSTQLSQFSVDFANTIYAAKGIRPICYAGNSYSNYVNSTVPASMPNHWIPRWPTTPDPQNGNPSTGIANIYGAWYPSGPPYPSPEPWQFWQYSSTESVGGISPVDADVVHGDIEYLKDFLVPALWTKTNATSTGLWTDVHNWNSDIDASGDGPAARLPGSNDTVTLDSSGYSNAITLDSATHTIRKLIVKETLNITGGTLTVGYVPYTPTAGNYGAGLISAEFDGSVTLSGTGALSVHTLQVDTTRTFAVNGGTTTFSAVNLVGTGKISIGGNPTFAGLSGAAATVSTTGSGTVDLTGGTRTVTVTDGAAAADLVIAVPIANGSLVKAGAGTMNVTAAATMTGSVTVNQGTLLLNGASGATASATSYVINSGAALSLDNATNNNANRIASAPITLTGGTLTFIGNATTESTGALTAASGVSTISLSGAGTSTLAFGSYGRTSGAAVNFTGVSSTLKATFTALTAGNFVDQGSFVNGADYAVYDAAGYIRAMTTGAGASDYDTAMNTNRHVKLSSSVASQPSITINTLNLAGSTVGLDIAAGNIVTLANGGIIKSGSGASTITGSGASLSSSAEYVVNAMGPTDQLTVSVPFTGGTALTKVGMGTLVLNASHTYSGVTTVAQGTLKLGAANQIPDGSSVRIRSGATLDTGGFNDTISGITLGDASISGGGTLAMNTVGQSIIYDGLNTGATVSASAISMGPSGGYLYLDVADGAAAGDLTINSTLQNGTGSQGLRKLGAGKAVLAANNTFTLDTTIYNGTLSVPSINSTATAAQPLGAASSAINFGDTSTSGALEYTGASAATLNRALNLAATGGTVRSTAGALTIAQTVSGNGLPITFEPTGGSITVSGQITGTGTSLIKNGAGTLSLTNIAAAYTGGTVVSAGVIAYANSGALGAGGVTFNGGTLRQLAAMTDGQFLTFNAAGGTIDTNGFAVTFNNQSSGAGGLTKAGAGTLTLSGIHGYTGLTTINAGSLNVTGSLAAGSTVMVNSGGTLTGSGTVNGNVFVNTGGTVNGINIGGSLTANGGAWSGAATVTGGVNVNTYGASFTLNASSNLTTPTMNVDAGTLAGTGTLTGNVNLTNAGAINLSGAGNITGTMAVTSGTWTGSGSIAGMTTVNNTAGTIGTLTVTGTMGGAGGLTLASGATLAGSGTINKTLTLSGSNRLSATTAVGPLTISTPVTWGASGLHIYSGVINTTGDTISGALQVTGTLGGSGTANITSGTVTGTGTISKPTTLTAGGIINFGTTVFATITYTGAISSTLGISGTGGSWNGIGSVSGLTTVSAGNLNIGSAGNLTANGNLSVTGTGTISASAAASAITGSVSYGSTSNSTWAGNIAGSAKTLTVTGPGMLTLTSSNAYTGNTTLNGGVLAYGATNQLGSLSNTIVFGGGALRTNAAVSEARAVTLNAAGGTIDTNGFSSTFTGLLSGAGGLTKIGLGGLTLTNNETYLGATNITQSTLNITGSTAAASTVNVATAGVLAGTGTVNGNATLTGAGIIAFSSTGNIAGTLGVTGGTWLGLGSVGGVVTSSSSTFTISASANLTANSGVNVTGGTIAAAGAAATITGSLNYTSGSNSTWAGVIAGAGKTLTLNNAAATLTLSGANTYTGQTSVTAGVLRLTASNNIAASSGVATAAAGTVQLSNGISVSVPLAIGGAGVNGSSVTPPGTIGALDALTGTNTWAGNITLNGTGGTTGDPLMNQMSAAAGATLVVPGVISSGTGATWCKTGDGDVVLTGASPSTYTNLTRLEGGRLIIEKDGALGAAGSPTGTTGNTFQVALSSSTLAFRAPASSPAGFNYATYEWIHTEGNGAPGFGQIDNLGGDNTFAGYLGLGGPGATPTASLGVSAGSLKLTGGIYARGATATRIINKLGSGTLIIAGDSNPASTNSSDVALAASTFNVNAGTVRLESPTPTTTNLPGVTTWNIAGPGVLQIGSGLLKADTVNINTAGLALLAAGGSDSTLRTTNLNIAADAKLDLADHKAIVDHAGSSPIGAWNGSAYTGLTGKIVAARNTGNWDGFGIVTSMTAAQGPNALTTVGIAEASTALGISGTTTTTWQGQSVDATTVLMKYTYLGDADLSGDLDGDDYFLIDAGYNASASGFGNGDFNYDGIIDADDYFLIDTNYSKGLSMIAGAPPAGVSSVPEPGGAVAAAAAVGALAGRRRRRSRE